MIQTNLLNTNSVFAHLKVSHKKQALQELAHKAGTLSGVHERVIFEALLERERLGTTGVGRGIAIPHAKIPGLKNTFGVLARLEKPIDFEAIDGQAVDLIFALLSPLEAGADHLQTLAWVSRVLRDSRMCEKLRGSATSDAMLALLSHVETSQAA